MTSIIRDSNRVPAIFGVSSVDGLTPTQIKVNPSTGAMLIDKTSLGALGGGGLFARPSTLTVAASNSKDTKNADYVCSGTGDQIFINNAINALPATGGKIILLEGTYNLSAKITLPNSYITIEGQGWETKLNAGNSLNDNIINFSPSSGNVMEGIILRNFEINANGNNQTSGDAIYCLGAIFCRFENIHITIPYNSGIHLYTDNIGDYGHHNVITGCLIENGTTSSGDGIAIFIEQSDENVIANNIFQSNGRAAGSNPFHIKDIAGLNTIVNNQFVTGGAALKLQGPHSKAIGNTFDGCAGLDSGQNYFCHIHITGPRTIISKNYFYNIGFGANSTNKGVGLILDNIADVLVEGNIFLPYNNTTVAQGGIDLASYPPTNCIIENNDFTLTNSGSATWVSAPIIIGGTGHIIKDNLAVTTINTHSSNYTITLIDQIILASGTTTITLPTAVGNTGFTVTIKNTDASNTVTVATTSSQTIDGATTFSLTYQYESITVQSDGSNWQIVSLNPKTLVTLTGTQTVTNKSFSDDTNSFVNDTDTTKVLNVDLDSATTSTTTTIKSAQTVSRTITLPDATDTLVGLATTNTLTNKRITRRLSSVTQSATPAINSDNMDIASITGLAQAITSMTTNLTGTAVDGDLLEIRITDNGTARAITWGASFESTTIALPTTTVISTMLRIGLEWNATASKWDCVAVA